MKRSITISVSSVLALFVGCFIGQALVGSSFLATKDKEVVNSEIYEEKAAGAKSRVLRSDHSRSYSEDEKAVRFLRELPDEPKERLESLLSHEFTLPGYALARLIPAIVDNNNEISESLSTLMNLSDQERQDFNGTLQMTLGRLKEIERQSYEVHQDAFGESYVSVPAFEEKGEQIRQALLSEIEEKFGSSRRYIFEMQLLQAPTSLGQFGKEDMVLKFPEINETEGKTIVELQIGKMTDLNTPDARFQGRYFKFTADAFRQRFAHLLEVD